MHAQMTTELIRKKFKNNFDLCNFAIHIARNMIMNGNQASLDEIIHAVESQAGSEKK